MSEEEIKQYTETRSVAKGDIYTIHFAGIDKNIVLDEPDNSISKDIIRNKIKEIAEEPQIYVDTEKFDIEFEKSNYTIDVLKELLGE